MKQQPQKTYQTEKDVWREFSGKHKGHRFLKFNPLFALPKDLVTELTKLEFFSPQDEAFEFDLAGLTGGGFCNRERFGYRPLNQPVQIGAPLQSSIELEERAAQADSQLLDLLFPVIENTDIEKARRQAYRRDAAKFKEDVTHSQAAFAGWLIGDRQYRTELAELRSRWQEDVDRIGTCPRYPLSFFGDVPDPGEDFKRECESDFQLFFRRWGLETLVTWELPVPMRPEIRQILYQLSQRSSVMEKWNATGLDEAGLLVFLPWCMLRDRQITVRQLAESGWRQNPPQHLSEWLQLSRVENKKLGPVRYERMLYLFRVLELALKPRYDSSERWTLGAIDEAVSRVLGVKDAVGIRQIRSQLEKSLAADLL